MRPLFKSELSGTDCVWLALQVGLFYGVVRLFRIEEMGGFLGILPIVVTGFALHALLAPRFRPPLFVALSFFCILQLSFVKEGAWRLIGVPRGVLLVTAGLVLIVLCHLPIALWLRIVALAVCGAALAMVVTGWIVPPEDLMVAMLPILASMFMFRLIVYLYDIRSEKEPVSVWKRLSYFFMLPNTVFPLFPVIDFKTYLRTYYNAPPVEIYQKGIDWCFRGVMHLLLYRLVYYHFVPASAEIVDLWSVLLFMLTSYLLYLRVSGHFHLIVGILCLFGFNLPETHHRYYLASSFNDFWRRINIYWKDFMMKVFYYPVFLPLHRRIGMTAALVVSTLLVFFASWMLHSYQLFWIRGTFPITATDGIFWGLLGVLVTVNSLYEARRKKSRRIGGRSWSFGRSTRLALQTVAMFSFMCVLWSFWTTGSIGEWWAIVSAARQYRTEDLFLLALILTGAVAAGIAAQYLASRDWTRFSIPALPLSGELRPLTGSTMAGLLLVLFAGAPRAVGFAPLSFVDSIRIERLSRGDQAVFERGYYEEVIAGTKVTDALWSVQRPPEDWKSLRDLPQIARLTDDLLEVELLPSNAGTFKRATLQTNKWGMRDRFYPRQKPPTSYRIALLGASEVMGSGVADEEVFENLVEDRLNKETTGTRIEILNFAVGSYSVLQNVQVLLTRVFDFEPDAVFFVAHPRDDSQTFNSLKRAFLRGVEMPSAFLRGIEARAGIEKGMSEPELRRRLEPYGHDLLRWGYETIAREARERSITPVWLFLPLTHVVEEELEFESMSALAAEAGFTVLSLKGIYDDRTLDALRLAPWDGHMNASGHRLVADRLYQLLVEKREEIGIPWSPSSSQLEPTKATAAGDLN